MEKLIYLVTGARPNFIKIAPIIQAMQQASARFDFQLIHTGQHYGREMSDVFLKNLGSPSQTMAAKSIVDHLGECLAQ